MATGRPGGLAGAPGMTTPDDKASQPLSAEQTRRLLRWRMALGRYADRQLGSSGLLAEDRRRDQLLERIYAERGRQARAAPGRRRQGLARSEPDHHSRLA